MDKCGVECRVRGRRLGRWTWDGGMSVAIPPFTLTSYCSHFSPMWLLSKTLPFMRAQWGHIWECTLQWRKVKQMKPVWHECQWQFLSSHWLFTVVHYFSQFFHQYYHHQNNQNNWKHIYFRFPEHLNMWECDLLFLLLCNPQFCNDPKVSFMI